MKQMIATVAFVICLSAYAAQSAVPCVDDSEYIDEYTSNIVASVEHDRQEESENGAVVRHVYGEGTNSSFITRTDLTATQKRFIALGRRYVQLAGAFVAMSRRVSMLEAEIHALSSNTLHSAQASSVSACYIDELGSLNSRLKALEDDKARLQELRNKALARRKRKSDSDTADKVQRAIDRAKGGKAGKSDRRVK